MEANVLAQLLAQTDGARADLVTLRAIVEEAGELGAARALRRLGLADDGAERDVAELRELLRAWRDAKKSALSAAAGWAVRIALALLLAGIALKVGLPQAIRP